MTPPWNMFLHYNQCIRKQWLNHHLLFYPLHKLCIYSKRLNRSCSSIQAHRGSQPRAPPAARNQAVAAATKPTSLTSIEWVSEWVNTHPTAFNSSYGKWFWRYCDRTDGVGLQNRAKQQESIGECHKSLTSPPCDASLRYKDLRKTIKLMVRPMGGTLSRNYSLELLISDLGDNSKLL